MKELKGILKIFKVIKVLRKALLIVLLLFIIVISSLHLFINFSGEPFINKKLSDAFNREITVGNVKTSFPANIHIQFIEGRGRFTIPEIIIGGGLFNIFQKGFNFSSVKIINPEVTLERKYAGTPASEPAPADSGEAIPPETIAEPEEEPVLIEEKPATTGRGKLLVPRFLIKHLIIVDGMIHFIDNISETEAIKIRMEKFNFKADNLNFTGRGNQVTYFKFKGLVPWRQSEEAGRIEAAGWVNLFKKDIQATLKIQDIDGIYLYPYYAKWVNLEKARIETARLNLTSKIQGLDNDLMADCRLELTDIVRKPRSPEETKDKAEKIADVVLDIFKALNQGKIVLDFTIKTKMTSPEFDIMDIKTAVEDKLIKSREPGFSPLNILFLPVKIAEGSVKATTEITKAMIEGSFAVGNEFKNALKASFTKEAPPAQEE
jgi:hypothetical protein